MALGTCILRGGEPLRLPNGWGWWHVECMVKAVQAEHPQADLAFMDALSKAPYTVKQEHTFTDPADGEVLTLKPGDVLDAWMGA